MSTFSRRDFLRLAGAAGGAFALPSPASAAVTTDLKKAQVVVIGGGFGGATCARYLKLQEPELNVTLVEPEKQFITCPFSNYVIAGFRSVRNITLQYDTLVKKYGITLAQDMAMSIDTRARKVGRGLIDYQRHVARP